ncbi:MAG: ABC transporter substrate-binding protein, partial [Lysobacterales bacterium]
MARFRLPAVAGTCLFPLLLLSAPLHAGPAVALGYAPKYGPGFTHFEYVNPDAPKGGTLTLDAIGGFDRLNPWLLKGTPAAGVADLMCDTLVEQSRDEPFSVYGLLADDIALAPDRRSVRFHLRPEARFADGSPVRAADVKASFDTLTGKFAHPQYRLYWAD